MTKELSKLEQQIQKFMPFNEQEEHDKAILLKWFESGSDILTRENEIAHLTASAWVVSPDKKSVLMAYHNIYHSWAWLGGHADGDADLHHVAQKEVMEESGLTHVKFLLDEPFSIEILSVDGHIKKGNYVCTHLHLKCSVFVRIFPYSAPFLPYLSSKTFKKLHFFSYLSLKYSVFSCSPPKYTFDCIFL